MLWCLQVRDFGDLSYLVKGNYERGMRTLVARARLRPLPRAAPLSDHVLRGAASSREGNQNSDDVPVSSENVHRALEVQTPSSVIKSLANHYLLKKARCQS